MRRLPILLLLAACGAPGPDTSTPREQAPVRGGTAIVGTSVDFDALNEFVLESAITNLVVGHVLFQNLIRYDSDLNYAPALADSFGVAEDGLSATFRIHENATWHDGVPVSADDVVWSFETSIDPETAYPNRSDLRYVARAERLDDRRVRFHFSQTHAEPLADVIDWTPMPKHLLEDVPISELRQAPFNRRPVGNGPFRFVSWQPNETVVFEANESFFGGRPYLDRIVFRVIPERTTLVTELLGGGVDLMPGVPPAEMARIDESPRARAWSYASTAPLFMMYNTRDPRFSDARVRRALTMAIDRPAIVDALLYGYGQVTNGPATPVQWEYNESLPPLPYDPEAARALLADAGWRDTDGDGLLDRDGRTFAFEVTTNQDNELRSSALVVIQDNLRKVGIDARPRRREFNVLVDELVSGSFEAIVLGFVWTVRLDPINLLGTDEPFNGGAYSNPTADAIAKRALATLDRAEAEPMWDEYMEIVQRDQPLTWLLAEDARWGVSERLRGVEADIPDFYGAFTSVSRWWIPEGER